MVCNNCGTQFDDGVSFCPNCGSPAPQPVYTYAEQPAQPVQPVYAQDAAAYAEEAKSCMVTGILAAAFGCSFIASIVGIIMGIIGLNKAKSFTQKYGLYTAKIRVGKYCSIGGIGFGIFWTIYATIYIFVIIAAIANR